MGRHEFAENKLTNVVVERKVQNINFVTLQLSSFRVGEMSYEIEAQRFVSSRVINKEREDVREARQRILDHEERKYNARREKEEEAFARGDHKWMLPNLE